MFPRVVIMGFGIKLLVSDLRFGLESNLSWLAASVIMKWSHFGYFVLMMVNASIGEAGRQSIVVLSPCLWESLAGAGVNRPMFHRHTNVCLTKKVFVCILVGSICVVLSLV